MLYIIGLGLNEKGISLEGLEAVRKCKKIYLDSYTSEIPYSLKNLEKIIGKKIIKLNRERIESDNLIKEAKKEYIALLVYGSPLFATTHIILIEDCKKLKVKFKIIHNTSIFDAIAETGLQLYKLGKIASMPKWHEYFKPTSFLDVVKENEKINAHSLILIDIGLDFKNALEQLVKASENKKFRINKIIVFSRLGTGKGKAFYNNINNLKKLGDKKIKAPFCFIIPGKMHFIEEEIIENL